MVSAPANTILVIIPNAAAAWAAAERIQKYLLSPDREDKREFLDKRYSNGTSNGHGNGNAPAASDASQDLEDTTRASAADGSIDGIAVNMEDLTIRPASTADPVLKNISAALKKGNLVVISGAVGTGKTTLAKALLGDLPPDSGVIQTAYGSIAYCAQTAWLINGTIKDVIRGAPGGDAVDDEWYKRVVHACDLEEDFDQLPDGDLTVVGSRGITLSGGQKQRAVSKGAREDTGRRLSRLQTGPGQSRIRSPEPDYPGRRPVGPRRNDRAPHRRQSYRPQGVVQGARHHSPPHNPREYVMEIRVYW